jgi:hypothetical protein
MSQPTAPPQSVTEIRTMALAMFADAVPCYFETMDPSCEKAAAWVAYFTHEENTTDCAFDMAWPLCGEHKNAILRVVSPFWRMWLQSDPMLCEQCQAPIRLDRFDPIK